MHDILIYLLTVNALGLLLMLVDKKKAQNKLRRISEWTLFLTAALGGSIGCLLGMYWFQHKTKHLSFTLGMSAILALQALVAYYLALKFL